MSIFETYSKRQKRLSGEDQLDVYTYDPIPQTFRQQIIWLWKDAGDMLFSAWEPIHDVLARELGVPSLVDDARYAPSYFGSGIDAEERCRVFLLSTDTNGVLDIVELTARWMSHYSDAAGFFADLNARFREHGLGYEYCDGMIIRLDSTYLHVETVTPALSLLRSPGFDGPREEFLKAHVHFRESRSKEAIAEALKSLESTIKAICDSRKWKLEKGATAKTLIQVVFENGLIPEYLRDHFVGLQKTLEAGLPTVRNKTSGHGQGAVASPVEVHVVAYSLHLAATNIVFLIESHIATK